MAKKAKPIAGLKIIPAGDGYEFEIDSDLDVETLAALLHAAADQIEGKGDRAAGAWGR